MLIGFALFAVSWFLPVLDDLQQPDGSVRIENSQPPGWVAMRLCWSILTEDQGFSQPKTWKSIVLGSTCLTNVLMPLAAVAMLALRRHAWIAGALLLKGLVLNLSWLYLTDGSSFDALGIGYFLWTASFGIVGVGLLLNVRRTSAPAVSESTK